MLFEALKIEPEDRYALHLAGGGNQITSPTKLSGYFIQMALQNPRELLGIDTRDKLGFSLT